MMIVFVILIYFNGLLVSSESNYLPFLYPTDYLTISNTSTFNNVKVSFPSTLEFGSDCFKCAYIQTKGYITLDGVFFIDLYFDRDIDLIGRGEVRYAIITPTTNLSLCNQVNDYLSNSTGSSVSVKWILWAYWYDLCPYTDNDCNHTESNHFQVVLAHQSNASYAVFIYKCGLIRWTTGAFFGIIYDFGRDTHPLANTSNDTNIDCYDAVSGWTNIVYRLNQEKFEFLSITPHSITVSWKLSIPAINSTLILSITDLLQTVNDTINVTGHNVYTYTDEINLCNVFYTFKLTLPKAKTDCNEDIKLISTALTPKPDNVSALYLTNETLIIRFQIHQCFMNEMQLFLVGANTLNTLGPLDINSLQYIDGFYIIHWNIKLNDHSLYYLTVSAIGTYGTSSSNVTKINTYNVQDIIIERNEDIVCFICVTEKLNECQVITGSTTTTLIPQSIQTNGTCYLFTDNGTYTVYAHDIENGIKILTPAIVIEYTVDWIEPTQTATDNIDHQSQSQIIIIILGDLLGLTAFAILILSLAMIIILRKKGKARSNNSISNHTPEAYEIPVTTKKNLSFEMISNEIPSTNKNYYETVVNSTTTYDVPRPQASQS
uniref:NIDO domain-containing protein n=1 Tax=Amphimedon queenslandica TaxID=400682 RepID=A0A1X7T4V8_AMPQE